MNMPDYARLVIQYEIDDLEETADKARRDQHHHEYQAQKSRQDAEKAMSNIRELRAFLGEPLMAPALTPDEFFEVYRNRTRRSVGAAA